jgi:hypothetical protein
MNSFALDIRKIPSIEDLDLDGRNIFDFACFFDCSVGSVDTTIVDPSMDSVGAIFAGASASVDKVIGTSFTVAEHSYFFVGTSNSCCFASAEAIEHTYCSWPGLTTLPFVNSHRYS